MFKLRKSKVANPIERLFSVNPTLEAKVNEYGITLDQLRALPWPVYQIPSSEHRDLLEVLANQMANVDFSQYEVDTLAVTVSSILGIVNNINDAVTMLNRSSQSSVDKLICRLMPSAQETRDFYYDGLGREVSDTVLDSFELRCTEGEIANMFINGSMAAKIEEDQPELAILLRRAVDAQIGYKKLKLDDTSQAMIAVNILLRLVWIETVIKNNSRSN